MKTKNMTPAGAVLVRIFKLESELELWKRDNSGSFALLHTYPMCRWSGQLGPKKREGDRQAPEGFYEVNASRLNPKSRYYLSFDLGYPNKLERALGYTGTNLMVHGACSSSGCFAISDKSVSDVYAVAREALQSGQRLIQVQSYPFRMTPQNMASYRNSANFDFWVDLKKGYDRFEFTRQPPKFHFCEGRYSFREPVDDTYRSSNPMASCPRYRPIQSELAAYRAGEITAMRSLADTNITQALSHADGGMHQEFRRLLRERGAEYLSKTTSSTLVPISRPRAALDDPYKPE